MALGFALSVILGGAIVDFIGLKSMWWGFRDAMAGIIVTIFAGGFWMLFLGTLLIGLGNGAVESAQPAGSDGLPEPERREAKLVHVWFRVAFSSAVSQAYFLTTLGVWLAVRWPLF